MQTRSACPYYFFISIRLSEMHMPHVVYCMALAYASQLEVQASVHRAGKRPAEIAQSEVARVYNSAD
jgi:hypothetical protein